MDSEMQKTENNSQSANADCSKAKTVSVLAVVGYTLAAIGYGFAGFIAGEVAIWYILSGIIGALKPGAGFLGALIAFSFSIPISAVLGILFTILIYVYFLKENTPNKVRTPLLIGGIALLLIEGIVAGPKIYLLFASLFLR